jgi:putative glutamine amidotransferase
MFTIASWIRESDEPLFDRFLPLRSGVTLANARRQGVDMAAVAGLLLTGGPDVDARFHNQPVSDPSLILEPEPDRDGWEFAALAHALERGIPILAICKGVQVLNLALGGSLDLHIEGHNLPELRDGNLQPLRFSNTARHRFERVNSSHHQALADLGQGLEVEAWSAQDDVIEQVRLRHASYCFGVQYHPERDLCYRPLFEEFLEALKG